MSQDSNSNRDSVARLRAAMVADDGSPPEMWDPQPGDQLIGELIGYEERTSNRIGDFRTAIVEDLDSGEQVAVFLTRSVLKNEFEKQAPRPGDTVGIKYHGRQLARNGETEYHRYSLRVVRAEGSAPPVVQAAGSGRAGGPERSQGSASPTNADDVLDELPF
jgi:hypothetical protein